MQLHVFDGLGRKQVDTVLAAISAPSLVLDP
jgi:hypothetical protein